MAFIITSKCVGTCDTACVDVCPTDCIHGPVDLAQIRLVAPAARAESLPGLQLYIDPEECIDCGACLPECPADAIFEESDVPAEELGAIAANRAFFAPSVRAATVAVTAAPLSTPVSISHTATRP